jgi:hypothetical protein
MPLGAESQRTAVNQGDTAELNAYIYNQDETPVSADELLSVTFTVVNPEGVREIRTGIVLDNGSGFLRWEDTDGIGTYSWIAQFTYLSGEKRSTGDQFTVFDPFNPILPSAEEQIADEVWWRLESCFDSEEGGPWLRDMTLSYFGEDSIIRFIPEGLLLVNITPPTTNIDLPYFTTSFVNKAGQMQADPDRPVIAQATLMTTIKHLMRSYVEQPAPQGANIVYQDRRDYLQRWQTIYQIENEYWLRLVGLWKRSFLEYGRSKMLIHSKAGRAYNYPGFRLRNASRGFW